MSFKVEVINPSVMDGVGGSGKSRIRFSARVTFVEGSITLNDIVAVETMSKGVSVEMPSKYKSKEEVKDGKVIYGDKVFYFTVSKEVIFAIKDAFKEYLLKREQAGR